MHATIIYVHPWNGSFNKAILDKVEKTYEQKGKEYRIIDLNEDGFNPVMMEQDLALYAKGQTTDELVPTYQNMLKSTDELVFVFPIWWYNVPAILKGNPIRGVFIRGTLRGVGLRNIKWYNCGFITRSPRSKKERYLKRIARII